MSFESDDAVRLTINLENTTSDEKLKRMVTETVESVLGPKLKELDEQITAKLDENSAAVWEAVHDAVDAKLSLYTRSTWFKGGGTAGGPRQKARPLTAPPEEEEEEEDDSRAAVPQSRRRKGSVKGLTAGAPSDLEREYDPQRGALFGEGYEDPSKIIDFRRARQIKGGLPTAIGGAGTERDTVSRLPIDYERWIFQQKRMQDEINELKSREGRITEGIQKHQEILSKSAQITSNPSGFVANEVIGLLGRAGPHGAIIASLIGSIAASPAVVARIIKTISTKGLPLNLDWRRYMEEEINSLFGIEDKKRRLFGLDTYVITQSNNYRPDIGSYTYNSLENRDSVIISKIGQAEKAVGVVF